MRSPMTTKTATQKKAPAGKGTVPTKGAATKPKAAPKAPEPEPEPDDLQHAVFGAWSDHNDAEADAAFENTRGGSGFWSPPDGDYEVEWLGFDPDSFATEERDGVTYNVAYGKFQIVGVTDPEHEALVGQEFSIKCNDKVYTGQYGSSTPSMQWVRSLESAFYPDDEPIANRKVCIAQVDAKAGTRVACNVYTKPAGRNEDGTPKRAFPKYTFSALGE